MAPSPTGKYLGVMKTELLAGCALVLALAGCTKKEAAPATPAAPAAASPASPGQTINTGTPVDGEATVTAPTAVGVGAPIEAG